MRRVSSPQIDFSGVQSVSTTDDILCPSVQDKIHVAPGTYVYSRITVNLTTCGEVLYLWANLLKRIRLGSLSLAAVC